MNSYVALAALCILSAFAVFGRVGGRVSPMKRFLVSTSLQQFFSSGLKLALRLMDYPVVQPGANAEVGAGRGTVSQMQDVDHLQITISGRWELRGLRIIMEFDLKNYRTNNREGILKFEAARLVNVEK